MVTITTAAVSNVWTVADMLEQLGNVPANRVLLVPAPGTADFLSLNAAMKQHIESALAITHRTGFAVCSRSSGQDLRTH